MTTPVSPAPVSPAPLCADPIRLALLQGSVREGRRSDEILAWILRRLEGDARFEADVIDPRALDLSLWHDRMDPAALSALRARLAAADAFAPVFPELNRGYPAALKALIDLAKDEWREKPAGFVAYGGRAGGARAVEQLAQVLGELHVVPLRDAVLLSDVAARFGADGRFRPDAGAEAALDLLLDRLAWWAVPLREARAAGARRDAA